MNILLTGATGYLGSHLVHRLLVEGHEVAAFKRHSSSLERLLDISKDVAWYYTDDISLPFRKHNKFDAVIHTATCYGRQGENISTIIESNVGFPVRLLESSARFDAGIFINADTYFNTGTIFCPYLDKYSLSKKQFVEWGQVISASCKLKFANIRLEHVYGAGDVSTKFTTYIVRQCLRNEPEIALTAGAQLRDFIHIDDVVDAYLVLINKQALLPSGFNELGLGSGCAITIKEFVKQVHRISNSSSCLLFGALPYRDQEIMSSVADISAFLSLGWSPRFTIESGLNEVIDVESNSILSQKTE